MVATAMLYRVGVVLSLVLLFVALTIHQRVRLGWPHLAALTSMVAGGVVRIVASAILDRPWQQLFAQVAVIIGGAQALDGRLRTATRVPAVVFVLTAIAVLVWVITSGPSHPSDPASWLGREARGHVLVAAVVALAVLFRRLVRGTDASVGGETPA